MWYERTGISKRGDEGTSLTVDDQIGIPSVVANATLVGFVNEEGRRTSHYLATLLSMQMSGPRIQPHGTTRMWTLAGLTLSLSYPARVG